MEAAVRQDGGMEAFGRLGLKELAILPGATRDRDCDDAGPKKYQYNPFVVPIQEA